jgi:hypothetical protein
MLRSKLASYTAPKNVLDDLPVEEGPDGPVSSRQCSTQGSAHRATAQHLVAFFVRDASRPGACCRLHSVYGGHSSTPATKAAQADHARSVARGRCAQGDPFGQSNRIIDREDDYRKRRLNRIISPERVDAFAMGDKTPDARQRTYADTIREAQLDRERENTLHNIEMKKRQAAEEAAAAASAADVDRPTKASGIEAQMQQPAAAPEAAGGKRRNRWDQGDAEA